MDILLSLDELNPRLKAVDTMILTLANVRMDLARQVGAIKMRDGGDFIRLEKEKIRVAEMVTLAELWGLDSHFAVSLEYLLINQSCKVQMLQLQDKNYDTAVAKTDDEWYQKLKGNLLKLAERWADAYGQYDEKHFATREYKELEVRLIAAEIAKLSLKDLAVDLGCANGDSTFALAPYFERVTGHDISSHMVERARKSAVEKGLDSKVFFQVGDVEESITEVDDSVSFVSMNLGTASDMRDFPKVFSEIMRILKPGGRFFLSFYNREALLYKWDFLPWPTSLAAVINLHKVCLDVDDGTGKMMSIYARGYLVDEVKLELVRQGAIAVKCITYPTISAILPQHLFESEPDTKKAVAAVDDSLTNSTMGAYIIATGTKTVR